eukprot:TRINITY_DN1780_c0_g1_i1.p1 TRINITY_DN1780_c0_g1~~TRINITY_DN1780_c0_g1_i1.p1  ORF type:complete len:184 (-),score=45.98 TRINITY_DN1780_c0_g1_i1:166-717(-)
MRWRRIYKRVTPEDIKAFEKNYKHTDEERKDVIEAYRTSKGDMDRILDKVLLSTVDDEERFREIIRDAIKNKEVSEFKKFTKEPKAKALARKKKANWEKEASQKHAKDLEKKKKGKNEELSIVQLFADRNAKRKANFEDMISSIENKHSKRNHDDDLVSEPTEEEFQRIQKQLNKNKEKKKRQ